MEVGAIGFHNEAAGAKRRVTVEKDRAVVNDLNRSKREEYPDLAALQEERNAKTRREQKEERRQKEQADKELRKERAETADTRSYKSIFQNAEYTAPPVGSADQSAATQFEEDFM
jgi:hypothetical protein